MQKSSSTQLTATRFTLDCTAMIHSEALSRYYGNVPAVRDLSFHVKRGEVMGLLGPNGAGKSTTMKMLTCYLPPSSGTATIDGIPLDDDSVTIRRKIGYLPENAPSYSDMHVTSYLQFTGRMHRIPDATLKDRMTETGRICGLPSVMHRRISELSKGFKQRVGLAAAMLHDPECLILDEPTTGLDPNQILEIRQLIRELGKKKTVLLSSHVLSEVEAVCDRVMIIDKGQLVELGTASELASRIQDGSRVEVVIKGDARALLKALEGQLPDVKSEVLDVPGPDAADGSRIMLRHTDGGTVLAEAAFHAAVECGSTILEMRREQASLEDVFRRLTRAC
ncbi:MAG: ATP-binding cassette domain-containing protein [Mariprofundaceae bacterium]|nr:ATP-binding cassette domain-containing protein [Mariprofundaceae bacterium]